MLVVPGLRHLLPDESGTPTNWLLPPSAIVKRLDERNRNSKRRASSDTESAVESMNRSSVAAYGMKNGVLL